MTRTFSEPALSGQGYNGEVYKAVSCRELEDEKPRPCLPTYKAPEIVKRVDVPSTLLATLDRDTDDFLKRCQERPPKK
jgi:hypothetical protein